MFTNIFVNKFCLFMLAVACILAGVMPWYMISSKDAVGGRVSNQWFFPWSITTGTSASDVDPGFQSLFFHDSSLPYDDESVTFNSGEFDRTKLQESIIGSFALSSLNVLLCIFGMGFVSKGRNVSWIYFIITATSLASWVSVGLSGPEFLKTYDDGSSLKYVGLGVSAALMAAVTLFSALMLCCVPRPNEESLPY